MPDENQTPTNEQSNPEDIAAAVAEAVSETAASNDSADAVFSALQNERDQFFESWKRVQAEFEKDRKSVV